MHGADTDMGCGHFVVSFLSLRVRRLNAKAGAARRVISILCLVFYVYGWGICCHIVVIFGVALCTACRSWVVGGCVMQSGWRVGDG